MKLKICKTHPDAIIPKYQTGGSVAFDLHSCENQWLPPGEIRMAHCGIAVEVPEGYEMTVRQRSGMSLVYPNYITICIGTIDSDYRGEIMVPIINNNNSEWLKIHKGDRIAQAVVSPIVQCEIEEVATLSSTCTSFGG